MLTKIELTNFKNFRAGTIDLGSSSNLIIAPNGSGKTNLLEAIHLLAKSYSFNTYPELNLINRDVVDLAESFCKVRGTYESDILELIFIPKDESAKKNLLVNTAKRMSKTFTSFFNVIFFSPVTVDLIANSPDLRRRDIDEFLSEINPKYKNTLNTYQKVVRNRNKLLWKLRDGFGSLDELDFWNQQLIERGYDIIDARIKFFKEIEAEVDKISKEVFNLDDIHFTIKYISTVDHDIKAYQRKIDANIDHEIARGLSLYGPHRDEIEFMLNGFNMRFAGSRGQQRISALIYKLSQYSILNSLNQSDDKKTFLLLDDLFSELDDYHRRALENELMNSGKYSQIFITTSDLKDFSDAFIEYSNQITLPLP